jgi:hypothetical protein
MACDDTDDAATVLPQGLLRLRGSRAEGAQAASERLSRAVRAEMSNESRH